MFTPEQREVIRDMALLLELKDLNHSNLNLNFLTHPLKVRSDPSTLVSSSLATKTTMTSTNITSILALWTPKQQSTLGP